MTAGIILFHATHSAHEYISVVLQSRDRADNHCFIAITTFLEIYIVADLPDKHCRGQKVPDWMFPFAEAETTNCSSFAVIWRLKSFTFYKSPSQVTELTCTVPEFPGLCVTIPQSSLPASEHFSVTVKVAICFVKSSVIKSRFGGAPKGCYVEPHTCRTHVLFFFLVIEARDRVRRRLRVYDGDEVTQHGGRPSTKSPTKACRLALGNFHIGEPYHDELTAVKIRYPPTSIT